MAMTMAFLFPMRGEQGRAGGPGRPLPFRYREEKSGAELCVAALEDQERWMTLDFRICSLQSPSIWLRCGFDNEARVNDA